MAGSRRRNNSINKRMRAEASAWRDGELERGRGEGLGKQMDARCRRHLLSLLFAHSCFWSSCHISCWATAADWSFWARATPSIRQRTQPLQASIIRDCPYCPLYTELVKLHVYCKYISCITRVVNCTILKSVQYPYPRPDPPPAVTPVGAAPPP